MKKPPSEREVAPPKAVTEGVLNGQDHVRENSLSLAALDSSLGEGASTLRGDGGRLLGTSIFLT